MALLPKLAKRTRDFDPQIFLSTMGNGRRVVLFPNKQTIFSQGDTSESVFYIQKGQVSLTIASAGGKEATVGILNVKDFFGEGALAGQPLRVGSATARTDCQLLEIDKKAMLMALHQEHLLSDLFVQYLLARSIRLADDLADQFFNSSEKRLARMLLLLARFGRQRQPETVIRNISHQTLAEMIGVTRSRVTFFMNRFRQLGFIDYDGQSALHIHSSLLNVVLHD